MISITVDTGSMQEAFDLKIIERLVRAVSHLEKEGFTVERFDEFPGKSQKRILTVTRPEPPVNNASLPL